MQNKETMKTIKQAILFLSMSIFSFSCGISEAEKKCNDTINQSKERLEQITQDYEKELNMAKASGENTDALEKDFLIAKQKELKIQIDATKKKEQK